MTNTSPRPMHAGVLPPPRRLWALFTGANAVSGILGPDVSEFQGAIDWQQVGASRLYAFARATFGTSIVDPDFAANQAGMRAYVKYRAYYHFLVADVSAQAQAQVFLNVVGKLQPGEVLMIDDESYGPTGGLPSSALTAQFAQILQQASGILPLHYSSGSTANVLNCPRIIASYGAAPSAPWAFWQYTDGQINAVVGEPVPGIGSCDENVFAGSETQLASYFLGGAPAPTPTPAPTEEEMAEVKAVVMPNGDMHTFYVNFVGALVHHEYNTTADTGWPYDDPLTGCQANDTPGVVTGAEGDPQRIDVFVRAAQGGPRDGGQLHCYYAKTKTGTYAWGWDTE